MAERATAGRLSAGGGFTLIELLVAISILAIVAVLGWRGLDGIVRARVALGEDMEQTRGMQLAFAQLQSDCGNLATPAMLGGRPALMADNSRLVMVRGVLLDNQPSRLSVVAYHINGNTLTRRETAATRDMQALDALWTATLDGTDGAQPVALQRGVAGMVVQTWYSDSPGWRVTTSDKGSIPIPVAPPPPVGAPPTPGQPGAAPSQPVGLEVSLQLQGRASGMTKAFLLGAG